MFVIWNPEARKYVSQPGSRSSYTAKLELARTYPTKEAAERECCDNERVRSVADIMAGSFR